MHASTISRVCTRKIRQIRTKEDNHHHKFLRRASNYLAV